MSKCMVISGFKGYKDQSGLQDYKMCFFYYKETSKLKGYWSFLKLPKCLSVTLRLHKKQYKSND